MRSLLPVFCLLLACGPGESVFPAPSGNINTDWNDGEGDPSPYDTADDDDDNGGGGDNGGGDNNSGGDLYVQKCVNCHGQDGEGSDSAPALAGEIDTLTDSELTDVLLSGTGDMPAPGLSEADAATLLTWLRNAWK